MIPISFSAWTDFDCPFRFKVLRIDKSYKEPITDPLKIGSLVAESLAEYRKHCISNGLKNDVSFLDNIDIDGRAAELIKSFKRTEFVTVPTDAKWVQIEGKFAFDENLSLLGSDKQAWLHPRVAFRTVVDFAYFDPQAGELVIIDDKTGYGEADDLQLKLYAHLLKTAWMQDNNSIAGGMQLRRIRCIFNYLAKRETEEFCFDPPETNPMHDTIVARIREVNSCAEWSPRICSSCKWCSVPGCEIRESTEKALVQAEGSPVIEIPSEIVWLKDAERALQFLSFAENIVSTVKGLLRDWVEANGPVASGGKIAKFSERESWAPKDLAMMCRALTAYGAPPELIWNNLSLTKSSIEKIVKKAKLEGKLPFIEAMVTKKSYKAFGVENDRIK